MRRALPVSLFLTTLALATTTQLNAQTDRFAYAITDLSKEGAGWNALRKLDLSTGEYSNVLLNGSDDKTITYDAASKKAVTTPVDSRFGNLLQMPFGTGVAAVAYDKKHNRLYYTPMFVDQLRYVDLKTMKVYYVTDQSFTKLGTMHNDEGKIVTRMVIAPDGNGYAITNDGNTLVRFSTGKKMKIEQLGTLVDDPSNNGISIHNRCSSFGGDMIADDQGNLIIISARNHVFTVNTDTKVAKHLGSIEGLPSTFTVNGAVVDAEGHLLVSSAVDGRSYFVVNPKDWTASAYTMAKGVYRSSDLANSNFLASPSKQTGDQEKPFITRAEEKFSKQISVYPNPVTSGRITVEFSKVPKGDYTVELTDVLGRAIQQKRITINAESQTQVLPLQESNAKGIYMVKVFDREKQSVFTQKVMIQ
jgi:hypothetical protein